MSTSSFWSQPLWVTPYKIQQLFNKGQYFERLLRGELRQQIFGYNNHLTRRQREKINEPKCTRSQMVLYFSLEGQPLALVHQYKRKSGDLGGSGRPDPKRLFMSGRVVAVRQSP